MKEEMKNLEGELIKLEPEPLSEALYLRLNQAMQRAHQEATTSQELSLEELEQTLEKLAPSGLSHGFLSRMDTAMQEWQEEGEKEAKIVPFSGEQASNTEPAETWRSQPQGQQAGRFWNYASVAAVALFGGLLALTLPEQSQNSPSSAPQLSRVDQSDRIVSSTALAKGREERQVTKSSQLHPVQLTRSSADRNIIGISSEGVRKNHHDQPCRCLKVEYVDVIEMRNSDGKQIKIEEPKIEYLYIPIEEN